MSGIPQAAISAAAEAIWPCVAKDGAHTAEHIAKRALEAAAPHLRAAVRERIAALAANHAATYPVPWGDGERHPLGETKRKPFADLIREENP
jgi:hypothetical protein